MFAEVSLFVQAARQDAERAALGHGQNRKGRAQLDPIWRENTDVRSGLWPEPWMAQAKGPSARAVGQEGEPKVPDVSRANKRGRRPLVTLGLSKVTRPGPKGGRNSVEGEASCPMRCSRIKGPTAGSGIRRESVVVERTISCGAMRCAYCTLRCHHINSANVRIRCAIRTYGPYYIINLRGALTPLTLALSRRDRGQRDRTQKR